MPRKKLLSKADRTVRINEKTYKALASLQLKILLSDGRKPSLGQLIERLAERADKAS